MRRDYVTVPNADVARVQESVRIAFRDLGDCAWGKLLTVILPDAVSVEIAHGLSYVPRAILMGAPSPIADVEEFRDLRTATTITMRANSFSGSDTTFDLLVF